ncbi:uncharacterized protein LOC125315250 [Rhodamnia argentea]|uniref:Uncharacterized protein LOC125315250 n=1 Tax=Rhodamnia argentea TaxID=178133 RepID=A0ABM3HGC2_9MYRT|nr:uncharacterized protein LOC125315250 [Rhodamnia argentea]
MEVCHGPPVPPSEKTFCVSPATSNGMPATKNSERKQRLVIRFKRQNADSDGSTAGINPSPVDKAEEMESKKEIPKRIKKFPVALSREEIEGDLALLTGGKIPRMKQKRPRSVHQHNDHLFPGAHLGSIRAKNYNVP